jgi:hypothetical protein
MSNNSSEKRTEARLPYSWPIWFADNFDDTLAQGQMIDISSKGASFTSYADNYLYDNQQITARFSVPKHHARDPFDLDNFVRRASICRVEHLSSNVRKIAVQFHEPLPFNPASVDRTEIIEEATQTPELATAI